MELWVWHRTHWIKLHGLCYEAKTDNGSGTTWYYKNVDLGRLYSLKLL